MEEEGLIEMEDSMTAYVARGWSLEGQLPLLIGIAALLGLGKGGVPGFATVATAATVATSPTDIPGGLGLAVALQVPILTMIDISAAWLHYQDLDFDSIRLLLPMSFVGMALGIWLDKQLTDSNARLLVGLLLLMILAVQLVSSKDSSSVKGGTKTTTTAATSNGSLDQDLEGGQQQQEQQTTAANSTLKSPLRRRNHANDPDVPGMAVGVGGEANDKKQQQSKPGTASSSSSSPTLDRKTKYLWACVVGIVGGAATMLTNAMGPILNVFLLSVVQLSPTSYIGTRAMFFCFLNCGKLPMRFYSGTLGWKMIPLAGFLGLISVLGVLGAKPIMLSMSPQNFVKLELAVVAFSGIRLCWMGLTATG